MQRALFLTLAFALPAGAVPSFPLTLTGTECYSTDLLYCQAELANLDAMTWTLDAGGTFVDAPYGYTGTWTFDPGSSTGALTYSHDWDGDSTPDFVYEYQGSLVGSCLQGPIIDPASGPVGMWRGCL